MKILRSVCFPVEHQVISDKEVYPLVKKMFSNPDFARTEGESYADCQRRVVKVLKEILMDFQGQKL